MDFIFQDDGADIIRRELMAPRPAIVQSLIQAEPSKRYVKMAQICISTIDDPHSPGGNSLGCKKETTRQRPVNIGNGNPAINQHPQGNFDPVNLEDVLKEELTPCQREQNGETEVDALANEIAEEITNRHNETGNPNNVEMGAFILRIENADGTTSLVRVNRLTTGTTGAVSMREMLNAAQREYPGVDASNIVAAVHLHPSGRPGSPPIFDTDGNLSDLDLGNTMPSHPNLAPGANDWFNLPSFLNNNGANIPLSERGLPYTYSDLASSNGTISSNDLTELSHYILGPDGELREYDYVDGHPAEQGQFEDDVNEAQVDASGECS